MNKFKIVTIGGGTGAPVVIRSLILAGFTDISAISTATDNGGRTGQMRTDERDRIISVGDLLRNLLALISPENHQLPQVEAFMDMSDFTDGRYRNLGYQIYYALLEKYHDDFLEVQRHLERLLSIPFAGIAIPVTLEPAHISFSTATGAVFHGERELDRLSMSANPIDKIWLDRKVTATPEAIKAIKEATHIIYCPGSVYASIIANLLPEGIDSALKNSPAKKILISNLVSNRNQTHEFTPLDYYRLFKNYIQSDPPFDIFVSPDISRSDFEKKYPNVAADYATEHSHFLGWGKDQLDGLAKYHIKSVTGDFFSVTQELNRIRHNPETLSKTLRQIIQSV
jgi:uncharacterized cofD-like protein